jgi:hypothetical protein
MATATAAARKQDVKESNYTWEGRDKQGKIVKGDMRATGEAVVRTTLRRQGVQVIKVKRQRRGLGGSVTEKDITLFTRQLATMMKAGVPLLQSFDIVGKGHSNPAVAKLLMDIKSEVETGNSLTTAFRKYPLYFDAGRYPRQPPGPPRDVQGEDPRHQGQDQVGAVLPDLDPGRGVRHHRGHHDFRDPGLQGSLLELRCRPPRSDAVRHGGFRLLR